MINGPPEKERKRKQVAILERAEWTHFNLVAVEKLPIDKRCVCVPVVYGLKSLSGDSNRAARTHPPSTRLRHTNRTENVNEPKAVVNFHIVEVPQKSRNQTGDYNLLIENYYSCIDHKMASRHPIIYKKKRGKNVIFSFHSPRTIE